jgi:DNA-binding NarL/FixJ family response regulator/tRNA A-37 threonylcarbamoyl transferase component Bud32
VIRAVIVDDEVLIRAGIRSVLETAEDIEIVAEGADGLAAVELVRRHLPDVVLLDIRMPRLDGLAAAERIAALGVAARVVVLTTFGEEEYVAKALRAGAAGFLLKDTPPLELVHAVRVAALGQAILSPQITRHVIDRFVTGDRPPSPLASQQPASQEPPVPGLTVLQILGHGGYSSVYRAHQESVGRAVALKIGNRPVREERDRRRFLREARAAGRLSDHPNVISLYDAGLTSDGRPYLVMELCPAGSLADRLRTDGRLPPAEVRDIGIRIADALVEAHGAGVLHRDLKPANILVNRFGAVGLADFGLAASHEASQQFTATVEALSPAYASPEAFRMERPTAAVDIYGLGATLYALLSGRPPRWPAHGHPGLATMIALHHEPVPDLPGVPVELTAVLRQAMSADPADRHASAADLRDALVEVPLDAPTAPLW